MTDKAKMTKAEALSKANVLLEIATDSLREYRSLNNEYNLGLNLSDDEFMYDIATDIRDDQGWSSSNC